MSATVNIQARAFAAALKCASKQDVRYYLNGAYLDFPKGRIVSTTGHIMFIGKIEAATLPPVIVPRDLIESALRSLTKKARESEQTIAVTIKQYPEAESGTTVTLDTGKGSFTEQAIDGRFPDYERVVPLVPSGEIGQYDADYIATCADALRAYTGDYRMRAWIIQHNGESSAALMPGADCLCVVMPVRAGDSADTDWYQSPVKLAAAA